MTEPRGQRTIPESKPPVMRHGWLDPRQDTTPQHTCEHPAATPADIGRRWRCTCGKTWLCTEGFFVDRNSLNPIPEWELIPPNPGRLGESGVNRGTVDDPKPRRRWWRR